MLECVHAITIVYHFMSLFSISLVTNKAFYMTPAHLYMHTGHTLLGFVRLGLASMIQQGHTGSKVRRIARDTAYSTAKVESAQLRMNYCIYPVVRLSSLGTVAYIG